MAPLKVDVLPGIGHVRRRILLEELNITLVREIAAMDMGSLKLVFGRQAYVIHQRAVGIDPTPVYPPRIRPTVTEEITLPKDENDDRILLGILYGLVEKCARQLRTRALFPRKAGLVFRYADQVEVDVDNRVVTLKGTVDSIVEKRAAGDDAWDTPGVVDVNNNLKVRRPVPQRAGER